MYMLHNSDTALFRHHCNALKKLMENVNEEIKD